MTTIAEREQEHATKKGIKTVFYDYPFAVGIDPNLEIFQDPLFTSLDASKFRLPDGKQILVTALRDTDARYVDLKRVTPTEYIAQIQAAVKQTENLLPFDLGISIDGLETPEKIDQVGFQLTIGENVYVSTENDGGKDKTPSEKWVAWPVKWKNIQTGQKFEGFLVPNDCSLVSTIKLQVSMTPTLL